MNHHIFELEPRIMFDAAVAATTDSATSDTHDTTDNALAPTQIRGVEPLANNGKKEVVFVDSSVSDYQSLIDGVGAGIEIQLIDGTRDGLAQIAAWASTHSGYDAIHILSHGSNGAIELGSLTLDNADIASHSAELGTIGQSLTTQGDILLYGCNVADSTTGAEFIGTLAQLSGADIAASTDATGSSDKGGDWTLEAANGSVDADTLNIIGFSQLLGTTPADQNFDSATATTPDSVTYYYPNDPITLNGITYSINGTEVAEIGLAINTEDTAWGFGLSFTGFSNQAIWADANGWAGNSPVSGNRPYVSQFIISSTDLANDFKINSFAILAIMNDSIYATNIDIIGYQGGVAVASVSGIDLTVENTTSYGSGNNALSFQNLLRIYTGDNTSTGGTVSFSGSNWSNIDKIVIQTNSTQSDHNLVIAIDSLDFSDPVVVSGPAIPSTPDLDVASDSGSSSTDDKTNDTTPTFTITGTTNSTTTVTLFNDVNNDGVVDSGESLGTATGNGGSVTITTSTLADGTYNIKSIQTDSTGTSSASEAISITIDTAAPTVSSVAITSATGTQSSTLNAGDVVTATVTMNEATTVTGTPQLALNIGGTTVQANYAGGSGTTALTFTYTIQSGQTDANGISVATNSLALNGGTLKDAAGNDATLTFSGVSDNSSYKVDTTAPTATITMDDTALKAGETSGVTITFSEAVTGFTNADLTITNGTLSAVSSADGGVTWTATFTPTADINDPSNIITLANTGVTDVAGNAGVGTTNSANYAIDTELPTVTITMDDTALKVGDTSIVTFTFTEAVTGFTNADLTIVQGTLTDVISSDGGVTWTATFTPSVTITDATNVIALARTGVSDAAGNAGSGTSESPNYTIDTVRPTVVSIVMADTALKAGDTSLVTITFSEDVTGFTNDDLTIANGTLSPVSTEDGTTWTATFTPSVNMSDTTNVITLDNTGITDIALNAAIGTTDSNNYVVETNIPTNISLSNATASTSGGTNAVVGALSSTDATLSDTFTYSLVSGTGDTNNVSFNISGSNLRVNDPSVLGAGTYSVLVRSTDAAGNTYDEAQSITISSNPTVTISVDDGTLKAEQTATVTFTFSEAPTGFTSGDITVSGGTLSNLSVDSEDTKIYTATYTPDASTQNISETISIAAAAFTGSGNDSLASNTLTIAGDTSVPSAPSAPDMTSGTDSGSSHTDDKTNDTTPTFGGTAEAGATITLYDTDGTTVLGTTTADGSGDWSITTSALSEGAHTISAKQTDEAGNISDVSTTLSVTIDASTPSAPSAPDMSAGTDGGTSSTDNLTGDTTPTFNGTAEAGATITLYDTDGTTVLGTTTADGSGDWSITTSALSEGAHTISAKQTDEAGNISDVSTTLSVTIDATAPSAPSAPDMSTETDSGSSHTDNVTSDTTPTFSGTGTANTTVTLYDTNGTTVLGTTTADESGNWSITTSALSDGAHTISAKQSDAAGNTSAASGDLSVTILANAPTITSGDAAPEIENDSGENQVVYTATSGDSRAIIYTLKETGDFASFTIDPSTGAVRLSGNPDYGQKPSYSFTVIATDAAGNTREKTITLNVRNQEQAVIPPPPPAPPAPPPPPPPPAPKADTAPEATVISNALKTVNTPSATSVAEALTSLNNATFTPPKAIDKIAVPVPVQKAVTTELAVTNTGRLVIERSGATEVVTNGTIEVTSLQSDTSSINVSVKDTAAKEGTVTFQMSLSNGADAPSWLQIDKNTGQITGTPPKGTDHVNVKVKMVGDDGKVKEVTLEIKVNTKVSATSSIEGTFSRQLEQLASRENASEQLVHILQQHKAGA